MKCLVSLVALVLLAAPSLAAEDALAEVNVARAKLGLRPFIWDLGLTVAAKGAAEYRAERLIEGHVDDFRFVPSYTTARAAGCAAWHGNDWGSCCWRENWVRAGAAWKRGRDGRRYMHIFVR